MMWKTMIRMEKNKYLELMPATKIKVQIEQTKSAKSTMHAWK
jgi:hypothetical protein